MTDLNALQEAVERASSEERWDEVIDLLAGFAESELSGAGRVDELWFRRTYGLVLRRTGRTTEALEHLERAYKLEPRDAEVSVPLAELLFRVGRLGDASNVARGALIHHKTTLPEEQLVMLYRNLGECHYQNADFRKARAAFDDAIRVDPGDRRALDGMLKTIRKMSPEEAKRSRRLLLKRLNDPVSKSTVLMRQVDELLAADGETKEVLSLLDGILELLPGSPEAIERKIDLFTRVGDHGQTADALAELALSPAVKELETKISYLEAALDLIRSDEGEQARTCQLFEHLLDLQPDRLEVFEKYTTECAKDENWRGLAKAYKGMIRRQQELDGSARTRVLPLLWRNLAELLDTKLNRRDEAIEALLAATRLLPKDIELRVRALELCQGRESRLDQSYKIVRELIALRPHDASTRRELANIAMKRGTFDEALCVLQLLKAEEQWSDAYDKVYDRLKRTTFTLPEVAISDRRRRSYLRPRSQSKAVDSIMAIGGVVFHHLFGHDPTFHKIGERDKLDLTEALLFNRVYTGVAKVMGVDPVPAVYVKKTMSGMANAVLDAPAFVVGPDMLSGRSEREVAFRVAEQLCLARMEYKLASIQEPVHLKMILLVLTNHVEPSVPVQASKSTDLLRRSIEKRLTPELHAHLKETVAKIIKDNLDVNVDAWSISVADEAARTGLLLCDDLAVADKMIREGTTVLGAGTAEERLQRLHLWVISPAYLALRRKLGIAVGVGNGS